MTTQLTFTEFKTRRNNFEATQPTYLQGLMSEETLKFAYKMYLNGKVPAYAKN